ncbi:hypothetical protein GCM10027043_46090 [Ferruginibacter profundus]
MGLQFYVAVVKVKRRVDKNNKARHLIARLCYIDGLVSTGNQIPYTILKRIFANIKLFPKNFINIFYIAVDNSTIDCMIFKAKTHAS